ncbi:enoyl-CoA hydratase/isomerase family protein [Halosimplex litoreum]|uniref:Enoyl-CoA hydratase/isomerase family protein n=1 Tax=Halosimplex litoreum TaxID=1198301 RepID=A0A7T3KUF1_9EURY|nr:enoyl-CoA hydratase/isomerase family protein [Halosimplex litoreum]QPV61903.1 enoyl-CoA hydratase/isomerase family protein [Halosimplex litoreum]
MIETDADGDVCILTLDRPDRRNALTPAALDDLEAAVDGADEPVVLLRGAGSAFCAGADLDAVADLADREAAESFARRGQRVARAIAEAESVLVAAVDGAARGGGVELALACDVRVATPAATFAESGATIGLLGAWGGTVRLPEVVGFGEAMDVALSGRVLDADEALRMGLVSRVVDDPRAVAAEIAGNDPAALRAIKTRLRDDGDRDDRERREAAAFAELHADLEW